MGADTSGERPIAYFMVRLDAPDDRARNAGLNGVVQRLGTGEKRPFGSAGQLVRLLSEWAAYPLEHLDPEVT